MGGQSAIRGFVLQALVTLFEALSEDHDWVAVQVEPNIQAEKVDILWHYNHGDKKAVQVKSSQNQIAKSDAERWAKELKSDFTANMYELILLGPCSQAMAKRNVFSSVIVPPPKNIDTEAFSYQLAHRLHLYMERINLPSVSARGLEMVVDALTGRLMDYSTRGEQIERAAFERLITGWITLVSNDLPVERRRVQPYADPMLYDRVKEAALDDFQGWQKRYAFESKQLIELTIGYEKTKTEDETGWIDVEGIVELLTSGYKIVLKGAPGAGKTITLLQLAHILIKSDRVLPLIVSAPAWAVSQKPIASYLEETTAFMAKHVTSSELAKLLKEGRAIVLLNGWNEIPESFSEVSVQLLQDFSRFTGLFVTTRERSRLPALDNPLVLTVEQLSAEQRKLLIQKWNPPNVDHLVMHIKYNRGLNEITRTPLFLAGLLKTIRPGVELPSNRYDLLERMVLNAEQRLEHRDALTGKPLVGRHREYLTDIASRMVQDGGAVLSLDDALPTITETTKRMMNSGLIANFPEPIAIANALCDHHLLVKTEPIMPSIQFVHQQFQEWFAATRLYQDLLTL
jgi:hypothetical protein